jgi:internalin A
MNSIYHMTNLLELNLGRTNITSLEQCFVFTNLTHLSLNDLNLTQITPLFRNFDFLVKLNLSDNKIRKMENMDEMTELVELNIRNNLITKIEGLHNCAKLEYVKMSNNRVKDVRGIRMLDTLKVLKLLDNPLDNCTELHLMSRKHFQLFYSEPGQACDPEHQPTPAFYERLKASLESRCSSSSGSNGSSD